MSPRYPMRQAAAQNGFITPLRKMMNTLGKSPAPSLRGPALTRAVVGDPLSPRARAHIRMYSPSVLLEMRVSQIRDFTETTDRTKARPLAVGPGLCGLPRIHLLGTSVN